MDTKAPKFAQIVWSIELRSERQEIYEPLYEDCGHLLKLENSRNQVIFGRRGSGKTHLIGTLYEKINRKADKKIACLIDIKLISNYILLDDNAPKELRGIEYFWRVISLIFEELNLILDYQIKNNTKKIGQKSFKEAKGKILDCLTNISQGNISNQVGEFTTEKVKKRIGFELNDDNKIIEINETTVLDYLQNIIKILNLNYLIICLDEWSSIPVDIQSEVADMINKAFFSSKTICFKVATIRFRQLFYNLSTKRGFELGADIFGDIDLDVSQQWERDPNTSINFFRGILEKHICYHAKEFSQAEITEIKEKICDELFSSNESFCELVKAGEGIPRDFLNIFKRAYQNFSVDSGAKKIQIKHVKKAAMDWYQEDKLSALKNAPDEEELLKRIINESILKYKTKLFIVSSIESREQPLQTLVDLRLLHLIKEGWSKKDNPGIRYDVYSLDYGSFIQILETDEGKKMKIFFKEDDPLPEISLRDIRRREFVFERNVNKKKKIKERTLNYQNQLPLFNIKNEPTN